VTERGEMVGLGEPNKIGRHYNDLNFGRVAQEQLDGLAKEHLPRPAEQHVCLLVQKKNRTIHPGDHDRVRDRAQQPPENTL